MNKPGIMIYFNMIPSPHLPDADRLRLYDAMMEYGRSGAEPAFEGALGVAWDYIAPILEKDSDRYAEIHEKRVRAARLGGIATRQAAKKRREAPCGSAEGQEVPLSPNSNQFNSVQFNSIEREYIAAEAAPSPRKIFTPPTQEELTDYVRKMGLAMDPQGFLDYYTATDWRIGSHPMKDWRAAARNWARRERSLPRQSPGNEPIVLAPLEDPFDPITY